jgi:hypothetical protein
MQPLAVMGTLKVVVDVIEVTVEDPLFLQRHGHGCITAQDGNGSSNGNGKAGERLTVNGRLAAAGAAKAAGAAGAAGAEEPYPYLPSGWVENEPSSIPNDMRIMLLPSYECVATASQFNVSNFACNSSVAIMRPGTLQPL